MPVKTGDYLKCDTTLVYTLLRNLTKVTRPTNGWGRQPSSSLMQTIGDDIERIREIRNVFYGHVSSSKMTNKTYTHFLKRVRDILTRMDRIHLPGRTQYCIEPLMLYISYYLLLIEINCNFANRGRLLIRTPCPVPLWDLHVC